MVCARVRVYTVGYWVIALINLESRNGITAGGLAIVIEICLLWCRFK
jgi:hypothetical protein